VQPGIDSLLDVARCKYHEIIGDMKTYSEELGKKSSVVHNRVFEAAWKHNAFTNEAVEALGEGSPEGQSDDSTSA